MKRVFLTVLMFSIFNTTGFTESTEYTCTERNRAKWEKHNERVFQEIKFHFDLNLDGYEEIPFWEHMNKLRLESTREEAFTFGNLFVGSGFALELYGQCHLQKEKKNTKVMWSHLTTIVRVG